MASPYICRSLQELCFPAKFIPSQFVRPQISTYIVCQSLRKSSVLFGLPALLALVLLLSHCDSTPGLSDATNLDDARLSNLQLTPSAVQFSVDDSGPDTTISVGMRVQVNDRSFFSGSPIVTIQKTGDTDFGIADSLTDFDAATNSFAGSVGIPANVLSSDQFTITITARTPSGLTNSLIGRFSTTAFQSEPPVILDANAPETVQLPAEGTIGFLLSAKASDPDGQINIDGAFAKLFDSNGQQLGSTFRLYDDGGADDIDGGGRSGDLVANDSLYSRGFSLNSENNPDQVTIEFFVLDRGGLSSDTLRRVMDIIR